MKLGIAIPHYGSGMEPEGMAPFARRVEQLGFDSLWVTDHIAVPVELPHVYKRKMLDAVGMLHYLAAVTERVSLGTGVMVLAYRHPVTLAKQIASADQLSGGRVIFGAAAGYMEGEFRVLNADYANRGAVADEALEVIRACWESPEPSVQTERFAVDRVAYSPAPVERPGQRAGPPVWIGGLSRPAMRRAVRQDGWHGMPQSMEALGESIAYVRAESERAGRASPPTISLRATLWYESEPPGDLLGGPQGSSAQVAETLLGYAAAGVEHVVLGFPEIPLRQASEQVEMLASEVLPQLR